MTMRTKLALGSVAALCGLTIGVYLWLQTRDEARLGNAQVVGCVEDDRGFQATGVEGDFGVTLG